MIEKMTTAMQEALAQAQQITMTRKHQEIDIPHLWRIFVQPDSFAYNLYHEFQLNMDDFQRKIEQEIDKLPSITGSNIQYGQQISQRLSM